MLNIFKRFTPKTHEELYNAVRDPQRTKKYGPINKWDVRKVTNMHHMFAELDYEYVLGPIGDWDVSNVTDMSYMFYNCHAWLGRSNWLDNDNDNDIITYDADIRGWDVSNVRNMECMFEGCRFNQDISKWDVSNVTNMRFMFWHCRSFHQDISKWNVSNVRQFGGFGLDDKYCPDFPLYEELTPTENVNEMTNAPTVNTNIKLQPVNPKKTNYAVPLGIGASLAAAAIALPLVLGGKTKRRHQRQAIRRQGLARMRNKTKRRHKRSVRKHRKFRQ